MDKQEGRIGKRWLVVGLVCLPLLALFPLLAHSFELLDSELPTAGPTGGSAEFSVLASDRRGMLLELLVPRYTTRPVTVGGVAYLDIHAPGLTDKVAVPGRPQLPSLHQLIALPPGVNVNLVVLAADTKVDTLFLPIRPSPLSDLGQIPAADPYLDDAPYPEQLVSLGAPGYFRDQRIVRLEFHPLRVNPARNQLEHTQRLLVRVDFVGGEPASFIPPAANSPKVEDLLRGAVLNYKQGRAWRGLPADYLAPEPNLEIGIPAYKIEVDSDGMYRATYADLLTAGMDVSHTNPLSFALTSQGEPVAIEWFGDEDDQFEPGEGFYFYGQKFRGTLMQEKYTDTNVYWLAAHGPPGPRMGVVDGTPAGAPAASSYRATVYQEQDLWWNPIRTTDLGEQETWFWKWAVASPLGPVTNTESVELTALASGNYTATVQVALFSEGRPGDTGAEHHAQVFFNNVLVDEQGQDGNWMYIDSRLFTGAVSQTDLISGVNQLDWVLRSDVVEWNGWKKYLNWFGIEYQRQFVALDNQLTFGGDVSGTWSYTLTNFSNDAVAVWDVSFPLTPTRVLSPAVSGEAAFSVTFQAGHPAGTQFIAVSAEHIRAPLSLARYLPPDLNPPAGADWIAVTHADFTAEAQRLADYRAAQGLRTLVVDVDDLYNQYSYGIYQPAAIHNYLAHALTWPAPAPTYALLVGDGNWNFPQSPNYTIAPTYIPPYLGFLDPYQGEVPIDNLYATLVGDDPLPDIALGRLPVRSISEMALVVDKIMAHQARLLNPQDWQANVVWLADNYESGNDFPAQAEEIAALLPGYLNAVRIYYGQEPYTDIQVTRQAVIAAFDQGATFLNYRGHGSVNWWAHEDLFTTSSVPALTNAYSLPVVVTMDCLDTYFAHPDLEAVSEELLRHSNGGSVGHWGSSGLGLTTDHSVLHKAFYERLFFDGVTRFGLAAVAAKLDFSVEGGEQHNLHTFTLLGDPAMPLMAADLQLDQSVADPGPYFPGDPITYTLTYSNEGLFWGYAAFITNLVPSQVLSSVVQWSGLQITPTAGISYHWTLPPVIPYSGGAITVSGRIHPTLDVTAPLWFTNSAAIASVGLDWAPDNNHATWVGQIIQPAIFSQTYLPLVTRGE